MSIETHYDFGFSAFQPFEYLHKINFADTVYNYFHKTNTNRKHIGVLAND